MINVKFKVLFVVAALIFLGPRESVYGQQGVCNPGSPCVASQGFTSLPSVAEQEIPGSMNPWNPFLSPPRFSAEFRITPVFQDLQSGEFELPEQGLAFDFVKPLGFVEQTVFVEIMARLQVSRFSARMYYDWYLRTWRGTKANFTWPSGRIGGDIDLYSSPTTRFGVNADFNWEQPSFSYAIPDVGSHTIKWPRPVTAGVHLLYRPYDYGKIAPVVELRYRRPLRSGTQVNEFEAAAGLTLPETSMMGSWGFRLGWRYLKVELDNPDTKIKVETSSVFVEYVFYY